MECVFDRRGQGKYFSGRWLEFRGSTAERERGNGWAKGVHPDDLDRFMTSFRQACDHQPVLLEFRVKRAGGSYARVVARLVPRFLDGTFEGYFAWFEEIAGEDLGTVRENSETPQNPRQALFQISGSLKRPSPFFAPDRTKGRKKRPEISGKALLKCLDICVTPMAVVDKNVKVVYSNKAFRALAANALAIARADDGPKVNRWPGDAGQSSSGPGKSKQSQDLAATLHAWLDYVSTPNEDFRIAAQSLSIAGQELTVFSIFDTSLEKRKRLLERAFLHDLVNAAGGIQILLELLTEGASRQEQVEHVKLLNVSIKRLLSEISHEAQMLENPGSRSSVIDVHTVLETLAEYYRGYGSARPRRIEIEKGGNAFIRLRSDQPLLVRTLDQILRFVIEANKLGDVVTLGCRQNFGEIEFWVHGPNIPPEIVRAHNERAADAGVRGAQLLNELCGGTMAVSPDEKSGTIFSIRYPAAVETVSSETRYRTKNAS